MKILKYGDRGAEVALLQLALVRAGFGPLKTDGAFGRETDAALRAFQASRHLTADGAAGSATHEALYPWYTGYRMHTVQPGDTLYRIAAAGGVGLRAVEAANPGADPLDLRPGQRLVVPLPFPVVPTDIPWCSALVTFCTRGIAARYPFVTELEYGRSVLGRPLRALAMGEGKRTVMVNAEHHANEWITVPAVMKYAEELARARAFGGTVYTLSADEIFAACRLYLAPAVNPDGLDLVTGALPEGAALARARQISADYPQIPFPSGWKANLAGTDLNLQYPAGWEEAKRIKYAQGYTGPAPRDFVGTAPLSAPEARALRDLTLQVDPDLTLAYHTQGNTIYWKYLDFDPPLARKYAECFAAASGYALSETPYASGFAGYKDWFIQDFDRPGYTVECGEGENPLPLDQFDAIYRANLGILTLACAGC